MAQPIEIDEALVAALIEEQFPDWSDQAVRAVPRQGWDNRTFRVGERLSARLPSAESYVAAVEKESRALAFLDGRLPIAVPAVEAVGQPGCGYPHQWSVRRWLTGDTVEESADLDRVQLANDLSAALRALRSLPTHAGLAAGWHSFYRGCHPSAYGDQVQVAVEQLSGVVDPVACRRVWLAATTSAWASGPVWFHGDVAVGNLLTTDGSLSALIDFGTCGVGDPACDLVMAWTYFDGDARDAFRTAVGLDDAAWRRARGWALWKALVTVAGRSGSDLDEGQLRVLNEIVNHPL